MALHKYATCTYCGGELKKAFGDEANYSNVVKTDDGWLKRMSGTYPARCLTCGRVSRVAESLKVHSDG